MSGEHDMAKKAALFFYAMTILAASSLNADAAVWRVAVGGTGDGTSWDKAFGVIQHAVAAASAGDEIWVAKGAYSGKAGDTTIEFEGNKFTISYTVALKKGIALYGGFTGTETARDTRDWEANPTIIDGLGVWNCVCGADEATLDGFTLQNGWAFFGAGLCNYKAWQTVTNCIFANNSATGYGGGIYNSDCAMLTSHCTFTGNVAYDGGGMDNRSCWANVENCSFVQNTAQHDGGGMKNDEAGGTVSNCTFTQNTADFYGGAFCASSSYELTLSNCVFAQNAANLGGGLFNFVTQPTVINCTFAYNTARNSGGAICDDVSALSTLSNCILWGDTASQRDNEIHSEESYSGYKVTYSCVDGGLAGTGNISADPLFVDAAAGNYRLQAGSPCIDTGTTATDLETDILGVSRPQGKDYDMGAYEYGGSNEGEGEGEAGCFAETKKGASPLRADGDVLILAIAALALASAPRGNRRIQ
jgi:predicted outer membrane repeat protein